MKIVHGPYAFHTKFQFKRKKKKKKIRHETFHVSRSPRSSLLHFHQGSHFVPPVCNPLIKITDADIKHRRVRCTRVSWKERGKKEKEKRNLLLRRAKVSRRGTHTRAQKSRVNEENTARFRQEFQPLACFPHPRAAFPCDDHDHDTRPSTAAIHGSDMIAPRECNALLFARDNDRDVNVTRLNILRDVRVAL